MGIPEKALAAGDAILDYIPQRPPMVMVDILYEIRENGSVSGLTLRPGNLFCRQGRFLEGGIVEHIAQCGALWTGYRFRSRGKAVPAGFLGAVRNLEIFRLPETGEQLVTRLEIISEVFGIVLLSASVRSGNELLAQGEMKVATEAEVE